MKISMSDVCDLEWVITMAHQGIKVDEAILLAQLCDSLLTFDEIEAVRAAIREFLITTVQARKVEVALAMDLVTGTPVPVTGTPSEIALHKITTALILDRGVHLRGCPECGAVFYQHRRQTHCSRKCINERQTVRNCKWCGKSFRLSPKMAAKNKMFCSNSCRMHDYRKRKTDALACHV